jgi:hypothetical protein
MCPYSGHQKLVLQHFLSRFSLCYRSPPRKVEDYIEIPHIPQYTLQANPPNPKATSFLITNPSLPVSESYTNLQAREV